MPDLVRSTFDMNAFKELVRVMDDIDQYLMVCNNSELREELYFARTNMKYWDTETVEPIDIGEVCEP